MKFSTKTTYGLRAMICLAKNYNKNNLSLSVIAKAENISPKYLEKIFASLKKAKLVRSEIGASGGYSLSRAPSKITTFEIIKALEKKITTFYCLDENGKIHCSTKCRCGVTKVLINVQSAVYKSLKNFKLSDLY